ncbi:hypothetical protein LXL04_004266 [Taraxacum kok-saghyz]
MSAPPQSMQSFPFSISIKKASILWIEHKDDYSDYRLLLKGDYRLLHYLPTIMDSMGPNVVEKKKYKSKYIWNSESSTYFIDMCLNEMKKGNKPGSHLNKAVWLNIEKGMLEKTGIVFDKKQLSNKWETMKRDWKLYERLMRLETGIGGTRSLIDTSEEWWAEKINANKEFAKFKDINLDIYATHYAPLFQDSVAVGDHTMTPLQFQGGENKEGKGDSDEINLSDDDALFPPFPEDSSNKRKKSRGQKLTTKRTIIRMYLIIY